VEHTSNFNFIVDDQQAGADIRIGLNRVTGRTEQAVELSLGRTAQGVFE